MENGEEAEICKVIHIVKRAVFDRDKFRPIRNAVEDRSLNDAVMKLVAVRDRWLNCAFMFLPRKIATTVVVSLILMLFLISCTTQNQITRHSEMPQKIVWAWERPEDLRFLDPKEFGVAFLAQTLFLELERVDQKARRQPLEVADGTYMIAVTRIETLKETNRRPAYSDDQIDKAVELITRTLTLPNVKGIQIDFDAAGSEREFYRKMMARTRAILSVPPAVAGDITQPQNDASEDDQINHPLPQVALTMTSLASWCIGDAWFNDFPVEEAVPMVFVMGADTERVRNYLRNGNDWHEPLCRGSYGVSVDEPKLEGLKPNRRIFYFKNSAWTRSDLDRL